MDDLIRRQAAVDLIESHLRIATEPYQLTRTDKVMNHAFEIAAQSVGFMHMGIRLSVWTEHTDFAQVAVRKW